MVDRPINGLRICVRFAYQKKYLSLYHELLSEFARVLRSINVRGNSRVQVPNHLPD